ncbi:MAG TPA: DUF1294 domain-containing protein [Candidatus Didemnitutus sp.]|nr:DUF1294 domain-containing protein [Candidatus Didemnitutus sp.]
MHFLFLPLLVPPLWAAWQKGGETFLALSVVASALMSAVVFLLYAFDKRRAKMVGPREPEALLHLMELLGGWPGAFFAQRWLRHKSAKRSYLAVYWLIVVLYEVVALDALRDWRWVRAIASVRL